ACLFIWSPERPAPMILPLIVRLVVMGATQSQATLPADSSAFIRINQVGYLPAAPKVAVVCTLRPVALSRFTVEDERSHLVLGPLPAKRDAAFGACVETWRLDFSALRRPGRYVVRAGPFISPPIRVAADAYRGLADSLMALMRHQRSGYNPF